MCGMVISAKKAEPQPAGVTGIKKSACQFMASIDAKVCEPKPRIVTVSGGLIRCVNPVKTGAFL